MTAPAGHGPGDSPRRALPVGLAVLAAVFAGACAATQSVVNGELGERLGSPLSASTVSNTVGGAVFVGAALVAPSVRRGLRRVFAQRLPWWLFTGGLFGAVFVFAGTYAVPLVGVALFTVAQVSGQTVGGLGTDAAGVGPGGRRSVTGARMLGAALAVAAVCLAQAGREVTLDMWWLAPAVVVIGAGLALQAALNGQINEVSRNPLSTGLVNFAVGTAALYVAASVAVAIVGLPDLDFPSEPWLYVGGALGAMVVIGTMAAVRVLGILRLGLAVLAGQLSGALVLDAVVTKSWPSAWVTAGTALTAVAVVVAGRGAAAATGPARRAQSRANAADN